MADQQADPIRQAVRRKQQQTEASMRAWLVRFGAAIPDPAPVATTPDTTPDDTGNVIPSAATIKAAVDTARTGH